MVDGWEKSAAVGHALEGVGHGDMGYWGQGHAAGIQCKNPETTANKRQLVTG